MPAWCLPPALSTKFLNAIRDGNLDPSKLMELTSDERRAAFAEHVGPENAAEVNAQFEEKMLLKDQQRGFVTWAKNVAGITETARADIVSTISKLDKVLQPDEAESFMSDLAARKLGISVTADEAREIAGLAKIAANLREEIVRASVEAGKGDYDTGAYILGPDAWTAYGVAQLNLIEKVESLKPGGMTWANMAAQLNGLPKTFLTSFFHMSAPAVQAWGNVSRLHFWTGIGEMFRYFGNEDRYREFQGFILGHPNYPLMVDAKLELTKVKGPDSLREEAIQSSLLENLNQYAAEKIGWNGRNLAERVASTEGKLGGVPHYVFAGDANLIAGWARSFTGYLNYVRVKAFNDLITAAKLRGEDVSIGSRNLKDIGMAVNNYTGRASLGKDDSLSNVGPALNNFFFAPRKNIATAEMFNPWRYIDPKMSPTARRSNIRNLIGSLLFTSTVLAIPKLLGFGDTTPDPRSSDFGRVNIGGEKFDPTGGNASYLRMLARIFSGHEVTAYGEDIPLGPGHRHTGGAILVNYIRGKLSPIAAILADAVWHADPAGHPFDPTNGADLLREGGNMFMPIFLDSIFKEAMNNPDDTLAWIPSIAAMFGVGLESPEPPEVKYGMNLWGQPAQAWPQGTPSSWRNDPVSQEVTKLGLTHFPSDKIRGVPLTVPQQQEYIQKSGIAAHMALEKLMAEPWWGRAPDDMRRRVMLSAILKAREGAAHVVILHSHGGPNDISAIATQKKRADAAIMQGYGATQAEAPTPEQVGTTAEQQPAGP